MICYSLYLKQKLSWTRIPFFKKGRRVSFEELRSHLVKVNEKGTRICRAHGDSGQTQGKEEGAGVPHKVRVA